MTTSEILIELEKRLDEIVGKIKGEMAEEFKSTVSIITNTEKSNYVKNLARLNFKEKMVRETLDLIRIVDFMDNINEASKELSQTLELWQKELSGATSPWGQVKAMFKS